MKVTLPIPSRSLRWFAAAVKWSLWLLLAAWLLLALAWGTLHAVIVPRIGDFRPALEKRASAALGVPVRIGGISAHSAGLIPSFELRDVVLHDPAGRAALRLPLVIAALSPRSAWNLGFEQLYLHGPELDIRRTADGRFLVAGLDFSRASDNDGRAADWFFGQAEFLIEGGIVRWTDELRGADPLVLRGVRFVMRNGARRHAMRLDASPPEDWGGRFTLTGIFRQPFLSVRAGQWQDWIGQLHADFQTVDLARLRRHLPLRIEVAQGRGRLRAWADVRRGLVAGVTADVALQDVDATLAPGLAPLALRTLSGRLAGRRLPGGFHFETQDLQFVTEDGEPWPGGNVAVTWTDAEGLAPAQGELRADRLDLGALRRIATRLPLGEATHAALQAYAPEGLVETLHARWQGPPGAPQAYEARGRAQGLAVAARPHPHGEAGIPGFRNLALDFDFTQAGGRARVSLQQGALEFPGVFEEPVLPLDRLEADVTWQVEGPGLAVFVQGLKFANADAQGEARASWRTGAAAARLPGVLDLEGQLARADGTRVWRYLPLAIPEAARHYVRDAVVAGTATQARFRVKGDLRDFPFEDGRKGQFLITAHVRDVQFAYVPASLHPGPLPWPALTQLSGELVFEGMGMAVRNAEGRLGDGARLQVQAAADIRHFDEAVVRVGARVRGPLAESLAVVNGSPVGELMQGALARARGSGAADVDLRLSLPITAIERSQVQGTVTLAGNDVQITPASPMLARARGTVLFSDQDFQVIGVQARALGGDVRLDGGTRPVAPGEPPFVQLRAQGVATAEGLRQAPELGFLARLARDFSGATAYQLTLGFRGDQPEVLVTSSLQGLAIHLPPPLAKPAEAVLPLRYETALARESLQPGAAGPQDTLQLELGRLGGVHYVRDLSGGEPRVVRGTIALGLAPGEEVEMPQAGVAANVRLGTFDAGAWEAALARAAGGAGSLQGGNGQAALGYLPTVMALRAQEIAVEGRRLHDVVLGGSRDGPVWRANVEAREMSGYLEFRQPQGGSAGRLHARLARLAVADAEAQEVEVLLERQVRSIPALDVVVDAFEFKGRQLGRLEVDAVNRGAAAVAREGGSREWRLNRLSLATPDATFTASGNWAAVNAQAPAAEGGPAPAAGEQRRTAMKFRLEIADAGQLLGRLGMPDVVRRGRGTMEGHVAWLGSPLAFDYPTMTGSFRVNVESGQFLKADPGIAKLLGVLSLQSLPRRLVLDFRDVFSEGFAFDFVRGDVAIEQGVAATNNLQMKGVNAAVLMEGRADLAQETQDLKVVVVPEINAGTASLVATVINPAVGLGSFLAQLFLREPLMRAATQEFHIDGTWADPRITRVARGPAASSDNPGAGGEAPPAR